MKKKIIFFPIGKVVFSTRMVVFLHILCSLLELEYFYVANKLYFNLPKLKNFCSAMSFHTLNTIKKTAFVKHTFCSRPCKGKTALNLVTTVEMQELLTSPVIREEKPVTNGAATQQALDSGTSMNYRM